MSQTIEFEGDVQEFGKAVFEAGTAYGARCAGEVWDREADWLAGGWQLCVGFTLHNKAMGIAICSAYSAILNYYYNGAPETPEVE